VKNNNFNRKTLSMSFKSLAFALGLVATANTTSYAMPIKEDIKTETHDHSHEEELEVNEVVVELEKNYTINKETVYKQIAIKEVTNNSISNYKGCSIVEALNQSGIDSSFANRKAMAKNYGINNYRGTASQNIMLLNKLKQDNISSLVKVTDINRMCAGLFGKDSNKIIKELNLPKTKNITKSDFARVIRQIANYMNVNTSVYDNKLGLVVNVIKDVDNTTLNNNDIAWSYYMGYTDIDEKLNYNGNNFVTVDEFNHFINSFVNDYNTAITNGKYDENGIVITPNQSIYNRDNLDNSKINEIRNPQLINNNNNNSSDSEHDHKDDDDKKPQHTHKFTTWNYYNDEQEISACNDCGKIKFRGHSLGQAEKTYTTNNDGTHSVHEDAHCNTCNHDIVKDYNANCDLTEWTYNSSTDLDERECNFCEYVETRTHEHSQVPSDIEYNFYQTNNNGTHKLMAIYNCSICNDPIVLYKDEDCKYEEWVQNDGFTCKKECEICGYTLTKEHNFVTVEGSVTTNATLGIHNETQKCTDCDYEKTVEVNCTPDGNREYYRVGDTVTEREHCSVCNDVCIDDTHTHEFGDNYTPVDADYHTRSCDCGEEDTAAHNFTDWVVNSEGKNTRECTECGYEEEKEHQCIRNDDWEIADETIIGPCYDEVITCKYEGCDYEFERRGHDHDYQATELPELGKIYYCCSNCYDDYEEAIQAAVLSLRELLTLTDEDDIYKEDLEETIEEEVEEEEEETKVIEDAIIEDTKVEEELEEIEEIKDLEPVEPELEETDSKVLVLK